MSKFRDFFHNINLLKYLAFILAFVVLFLPQKGNGWVILLVLAGFFILFWMIGQYGAKNLAKYLTVIFLILVLLSNIGSHEQRVFLWLGGISLLIWIFQIAFGKKS